MKALKILMPFTLILPFLAWKMLVSASIWHCELEQLQSKKVDFCFKVSRTTGNACTVERNESRILMNFDFQIQNISTVRLFMPKDATSSNNVVIVTAGGCTFIVKQGSSGDGMAHEHLQDNEVWHWRTSIRDILFGKWPGRNMTLVEICENSCVHLYHKSSSSMKSCSVSMYYEPIDNIGETSYLCQILLINSVKEMLFVIIPGFFLLAVFVYILMKFNLIQPAMNFERAHANLFSRGFITNKL